MAAPRHSRPRPRAAVVAFPVRSGASFARRVAHLLPSGRSLLAGFALVALAAGSYAAARSTSAFAVRDIVVRGAPPAIAARIEKELRPVVGTSLLTLAADDVEQPVVALADVASVSYDRAFPHTLAVTVRLEEPAVVVRRGPESWLVSLRGRVLRRLEQGAQADLPRVWVPSASELSPGAYVGDPAAERAIRAVEALRAEPLPVATRSVRGEHGELALRLATGLEVRLGTDAELRLKLAVAGRIVPALEPTWEGGPALLDVSVPERPVAIPSLNLKIEVES